MVSVLDCASRDLGTRPSPVNVVYICSREKHSSLSHSVSPPENITGYQRIVREAWWRRDGLAGGGGGVYSQSLPATVWSRNNLRLGRPLGWNEDLTLLQERVIIILYTKVTLQIEFWSCSWRRLNRNKQSSAFLNNTTHKHSFYWLKTSVSPKQLNALVSIANHHRHVF